jgi:hypothetical protein
MLCSENVRLFADTCYARLLLPIYSRNVLTGTFSCAERLRQDIPSARIRLASSTSNIALGRPTGLPLRVPVCRTRSIPACMRSLSPSLSLLGERCHD